MSAIPTVAVRILCQDAQGRTVAGAQVTAALTAQERYLGQEVPASAQGVTDNYGVVTLSLFPNELGSEGTVYTLTAAYPTGGSVVRFLAIPNAACDIVLGPRVSAAVTVRALVDEALSARDEAAQSRAGAAFAASSAAADADRAERAADDIGTGAEAAQQAATQAEAARDEAVEAKEETALSETAAGQSAGAAQAAAVLAAAARDDAGELREDVLSVAGQVSTKVGEAATSADSAAASEAAALAYKNAAGASAEQAAQAAATANAKATEAGTARDQAVEAANVATSGGIPKSIGTAAGDLVVFSGASTPARLPVGTTGQVLMAGQGVAAWGDLPAPSQCQLKVSGAHLLLSRCGGRHLCIDNNPQSIPSAGVMLAATGLTAGTVYFIYAAMVGDVMTLEASTTGHAPDPRNGVEVKSSDPSRTLVGMARPVAGPAWADSPAQRFVASYYNRVQRTLLGGEGSVFSTASTSFVQAGTAIAECLVWNNGAISATANMYGYTLSQYATFNSAIKIGTDIRSVSLTTQNSLDGEWSFFGCSITIQDIPEGLATITAVCKISNGTLFFDAVISASLWS